MSRGSDDGAEWIPGEPAVMNQHMLRADLEAKILHLEQRLTKLENRVQHFPQMAPETIWRNVTAECEWKNTGVPSNFADPSASGLEWNGQRIGTCFFFSDCYRLRTVQIFDEGMGPLVKPKEAFIVERRDP